MWLNTTSKPSFSSKSRGYIGTHEREVVSSTHDGLVSREDWDTVQEIMNRHSRVKPSNSGYENHFRGILKCPDCGRGVLLHTDTRKKCEPVLASYFQCATYRTKGKNACSQHRINAIDIEKAVLDDIRKQARKAMKNPDKFIRDVLSGMTAKNAVNTEKLERDIVKLEKECADTDKLYIKSYEDYSNGLIDKDNFQLLSTHYSEKQNQQRSLIEQLKTDIDMSRSNKTDAHLFSKNIIEYSEIKQLDGTMLNKLIEKIEVYEPTVVDDVKKQRVRIYYRCVGEIK